MDLWHQRQWRYPLGRTPPETWYLWHHKSPSKAATELVWTCAACHIQHQIGHRPGDPYHQEAWEAKEDLVRMCEEWPQGMEPDKHQPARQNSLEACRATLSGAANPIEWETDSTLIKTWDMMMNDDDNDLPWTLSGTCLKWLWRHTAARCIWWRHKGVYLTTSKCRAQKCGSCSGGFQSTRA